MKQTEEILQRMYVTVSEGTAWESIKENYCFPPVPLQFVDLIPFACQDKNFLYHNSGAWDSLAWNVKVTEFPSLLLGKSSPAWNIMWGKAHTW